MLAILSDIHSNFEALQAVLADMSQFDIAAVYCLGDMVGYGPDPRDCLDTLMECPVALLGNHDQAVLFDPGTFNPSAERAAYWTREQLEAPIPSRQAAEQRWEFLGERPVKHQEGDCLFVHASPRNPTEEYVFPEDIYNEPKMRALFGRIQRYCFQGHTHLPGIFTESLQFYSPEEFEYAYTLDGSKLMVNVGSVGQPRDGDWRACYALFDGETLWFRRVEYDVETTVQKILAIDELDDFLGHRLRTGR